jgi:hypothetical protein
MGRFGQAHDPQPFSVAEDQSLASAGHLAELHRPVHRARMDNLGPTAHNQQALHQLAHDNLQRFASLTSSRNPEENAANFLEV